MFDFLFEFDGADLHFQQGHLGLDPLESFCHHIHSCVEVGDDCGHLFFLLLLDLVESPLELTGTIDDEWLQLSCHLLSNFHHLKIF